MIECSTPNCFCGKFQIEITTLSPKQIMGFEWRKEFLVYFIINEYKRFFEEQMGNERNYQEIEFLRFGLLNFIIQIMQVPTKVCFLVVKIKGLCGTLLFDPRRQKPVHQKNVHFEPNKPEHSQVFWIVFYPQPSPEPTFRHNESNRLRL